MNRQIAKASQRCQHRSAAGRQCRMPMAGAKSFLCTRHDVEKQRSSDLTELFTTVHDKFRSPAGIHAALSELFTLLAENRLAPRRAAVLAYISSLMLRTLSAIRQEAADERAASQNVPPTIIWNLPRPAREHPQPPDSQQSPTSVAERQ